MVGLGPRARRLCRKAWSLATYGFALVGFSDHVVTVRPVDGISMQPTLNPATSSSRDVVLIDKFHMRSAARIRRGDVVSLLAPDIPELPMMKRVVAMPGDKVRVVRPGIGHMEGVVPAGHCWIDSDNGVVETIDSKNKLGPVPIGLIDGRAVCVVWPPWRFGMMIERREQDPTRLCAPVSSMSR